MVAKGYCKPHYRRFTDYGDPQATPLPEEIDIDGYRICSACGEKKLLEEDFSPDSRCRKGRKRTCKKCIAKYVKVWGEFNKERVRENQRVARIRRVFGSDGLEIDKRRQAGEGCDICGEQTIRMAVDHCHETDQVRGLLCRWCNLTLGYVRDDPARLRAMADYLERTRG